MILKPTIEARESILVYGDQGTGKSSVALSIARKITGEMYVVDTDWSYDRLLETEFADVADRVHVNYVDDQDWQNQLDTASEVREQCGDDDWFVYDSATPTWDACQTWFYDQVYDKDEASYFLDLRKDKQETGSKNPVSRINDDKWTVINAQYKKLHKVFMPGARPGASGPYRGHLLITNEATKTSSDFDDKSTKNLFAELGLKPKGQKRLPYLVSTVILLSKRRGGTFEATSVKDRGREGFEDLEVSQDFARWYLMKVAGWKPSRG